MNKLIQDSWDLLKKNPNLYTPPALLMILSGLFNPGDASLSRSFIIAIMTFVFINMAMTAGWLNEIKVVIASKEQKATFDDVLVGIGKYFGVILLGSFMLFTIIITLFSINMTVASSLIGMTHENIADYQKIWKTVQTLKPEQIEAYLTKIDPALTLIAYKWALAFFIYLGIAGIFYFFIGLWAQCCIFRGISWFQGWKRSFILVKNNLGIYTALTFVQSIFISFFFLLSIALNDEFARILLNIVNIITTTYFTVLFCLFIFRFDDDNRIELLKDEIQSPISEIPGPDNKK
jgi:hypothetical protein